MKRRSPFRWIRGLALELLGVAAIVWVAVGAPLPEADIAQSKSNSSPASPHRSLFAAGPLAPSGDADQWEARRGLQADWLPDILRTPAPAERRAFTRPRLEAAGERLGELSREVAAALLAPLDDFPLPTAGNPTSPSGPSCPSCSSW